MGVASLEDHIPSTTVIIKSYLPDPKIMLQAPLPVVPGTSRILLAATEGDELGPGALLGGQSLIEGGQRADSLVALKANSQAIIFSL